LICVAKRSGILSVECRRKGGGGTRHNCVNERSWPQYSCQFSSTTPGDHDFKPQAVFFTLVALFRPIYVAHTNRDRFYMTSHALVLSNWAVNVKLSLCLTN
jgi:hypothetical protein